VGEEIKLTQRRVDPLGGGSRKTLQGEIPNASRGEMDILEAAPNIISEDSHIA
jgi:hypothetical protein